MIAAADVNGTRYWKSAGSVENVHIHALWVFRPEQVDCFKAALEKVMEDVDGSGFDFRAIDIRNRAGADLQAMGLQHLAHPGE